MKCYSLSHLSDHVLLHALAALVAQDRTTTAAMLAHLAEVDSRRLYRPAAYPSMYAWCVGELGLSEDAAFKRIRAARAAREFPAIFPMLADGRLNLTAVLSLAPYLTPDTADGLLAAAANQSKAELERLLAERFPRPDLPTLVMAAADGQLAPERVAELSCQLAPERVEELSCELAARPVQDDVNQHAPEHAHQHSKLTPLSPGRFALQLTIDQTTHDKLRYAQALLGHSVPSGDVAQVLDRALDALVAKLEQRRFAATARMRPGGRRRAEDTRYVPAAVRRMVWQRDGGQCTFVGDSRAIAAKPSRGWSSTTSSRSRAAVRRRRGGCACAAGRTISSTPSARTEARSCSSSVSRGGAGRSRLARWRGRAKPQRRGHVRPCKRRNENLRPPGRLAWTR